MDGSTHAGSHAVVIRQVSGGDLPAVTTLDAVVTGLAKPAYWREIFARFGGSDGPERSFLVAERAGELVGYIIGEVRAWEFGAAPCGWVFAITIHPDARLAGLGSRLFDAVCAEFRRTGVRHVRTMVARDNHLLLSFFRSQGLMAGPSIQLERLLD